MSLSYSYYLDGLSSRGVRIEDIPIIRLTLKRKDISKKATGTAVVDTGFDGGIYPNLILLTFFEGLKPIRVEKLSSAFNEDVECEVYSVEASIVSEDKNLVIDIGEVNVYIPVEPDYIGEEVLIGREIINKLKILLDGKKKTLTVEV